MRNWCTFHIPQLPRMAIDRRISYEGGTVGS
jgi:hypothetical protein